MPGYNLVNGIPNHVHPLIRSALRAWDPALALCSGGFTSVNPPDARRSDQTCASP